MLIRLNILIALWLLCLASPALAADTDSITQPNEETKELQEPTDPKAKEAWKVCEGTYRRCMNGGAATSPNPFSETSCNQARAIGRLDPKTWQKCADWCTKQRHQCRERAVTKS